MSVAEAAPATYRRVLRNREFRGLLLAQVTSEIGDQIARVALSYLVLDRTDSAFLAVLAFVVSFVPAVFGSALLGVVADRVPRKVVLLGCDLARAVVVGILAWYAVDDTPVWLLLGMLLVAETFTAPYEAASRAVVPDILPDPRECLRGGGLLRVMHQADQVFGILAAGVIIALVGPRIGLVIDVATFAVSFALLGFLLRWRPAARGAAGEPPSTFLTDFREGWRSVFQDPVVRALVVLAWSSAVFFVAPEAVALPYAREQGASATIGALLLSALPAGAALGAYVVARLEPIRQVRLILPLAVASCTPLLLTSLAPPWQLVLPLWVLSGLAQGYMVPLMTTVMLATPPAVRGRVNGLAGGGFSLATAATFLAAGAAADLTSPAVAVTGAAVLGLALVGAMHFAWPHGELDRVARRIYTSAGDTRET